MQAYIIRRLIQALIVLVIITFIVFLLIRLLPGDPILIYISQDDFLAASISSEHIDALRHKFGLDRPLPIQYFAWISGVLQGDLGISIMRSTKVSWEIARSLPITLHLTVLAIIISVVIGIPLGIIAAVRRGTWIDTVATTLANIGITAPVFWVGILLIYLFSLRLEWLPVYGYTSPFEDFSLNLREIIMPVFCIAIFPIAGIARQTRSAMLEVIGQDYIRTAWSKGLREGTIIFRHALKNGITPVVTMLGMMVRQVFGGQVLVETVFNIPGMSHLAVDSVLTQDYALVQGIILLMAITVTLANIVVDISYGWLDPRVRYG